MFQMIPQDCGVARSRHIRRYSTRHLTEIQHQSCFSIVRRTRRCIRRRYPGQTQRIEVDRRDVGKSQVAPGIMELRGAAAEVLTVLILCALLQEEQLKNKGRKHS